MARKPNEITILDVIKGVLPGGTEKEPGRWGTVCDWPPDLFAAVATITEQSLSLIHI